MSDTRGGRAARQWVTDAGVLLLAGVDLLQWHKTAPGWHPHQLAASVVAVLSLVLRRRWPLTVLALAVLGMADGDIVLAPGIALFHVGQRYSLRIAAVCTTVATIIAVSQPLLPGRTAPSTLQGWVVLVVHSAGILGAPAAGGLLFRTRKALAGSYIALRRSHSEELYLARRLASMQERASLARALHDSVGHATTMIALRAQALAADAQDPATVEGAGAIHSLSRRALDEMRAVMGILNQEHHDALVGLRQIPQLLVRAGLSDTGRVCVAAPDRWPADVQTSAYHVVQEALTNAARYAPGARVDVTVEASAPDDPCDRLVIEVRNAPPPAEAPSMAHGGRGLKALAEQVAQAQGRFTYGMTRTGGFRVRAVFGCVPNTRQKIHAGDPRPSADARFP